MIWTADLDVPLEVMHVDLDRNQLRPGKNCKVRVILSVPKANHAPPRTCAEASSASARCSALVEGPCLFAARVPVLANTPTLVASISLFSQ